LEATTVLLILAIGFGLYMAWGIGANDVANAMATSVGSRAITVKQAIIIAAIFEFLGAFLAGGEVTSTIRKGIIDSGAIGDANILLYGMLSALLAAAIWLTVGVTGRLAGLHHPFDRWCYRWFRIGGCWHRSGELVENGAYRLKLGDFTFAGWNHGFFAYFVGEEVHFRSRRPRGQSQENCACIHLSYRHRGRAGDVFEGSQARWPRT
jgi:hypothetical protein